MAISRLRLGAAALTGIVLSLSVASCAGDTPAASGATSTDAAIGAVDLSDVCPATVVIQTDWNPQAEQGGLYQLLGPNPTIDADAKVVRGPLYASGEYTGVDVEVRAGGPAIGFTPVPSQMYSDKDVLLGWVNTDEAVQNSVAMPTTAVLATFEKAPWMIMWDPATYPDVQTIKDLSSTDATVRYFAGATWMEYLTGSGQLREDQVDGSYDGTPANFVAAQGKDAQQGFATDEPYVYQNELPSWGKPVDYQLIADTGYPLYAVALSVRTEDVAAQADCLKKLIPVVQQATVDYFADPTTANALVVEAVEKFNTGWVYDAGQAADGTTQQIDLGIVANGPDGTLGSFEEARVQTILDIASPILTKDGTAPAEGLTAKDLFTNEFLDPSIALPAAG
ncbi:ABC transporter substrate-binding protein [Cellulomonas sp. P5_E12]